MSNYHCRCGNKEGNCAYPKCHNGEYDKQKQSTDILERLKQTTKINGAYPKDIADAIKEIEKLRWVLELWKQADQENRKEDTSAR